MVPMPEEEIPPEELALLDGAFAEMRAFGMELPSEEGWFPQLLIGLLNATLREFQHLKLGLRYSTAMVAWACHNLLDLHIYTRYALASEANARRLSGERLSAAIELLDSYQAWLARNDPALLPPGLEETIHDWTGQRADAGLEDTPPLKLKRLSGEAGLADEYANMSRLAAALSQPNAFSILPEGDGDAVSGMRPMLFRAGAGHGLEVLRLMKEHVAGFGARA
jgi:hypothetical protein